MLSETWARCAGVLRQRWSTLADEGEGQRRSEAGFTLVELLVVVVIVGIIAAIAIPTFLDQRAGAQNAAAQSDLRNAATAQEAYYLQEGSYSSSIEELPGFNNTDGVTISATSAGDDGFCLQATHESTEDTFYFGSDTGRVQEEGC